MNWALLFATPSLFLQLVMTTFPPLVPVGVPGQGSRDPGYLRLSLDDKLWGALGVGAAPLPAGLKTHVIAGGGGLGKSSAAREMLLRARDERAFPGGCVYINMDSEATATESLRMTAVQNAGLRAILPHDALKNDDTSVFVQAVISWFSAPGRDRWLAVYDNADSPASLDSLLTRFLPSDGSANGHVVITTRQVTIPRVLIDRGCLVDVVSELSSDDSMLLLLNTTLLTVSSVKSIIRSGCMFAYVLCRFNNLDVSWARKGHQETVTPRLRCDARSARCIDMAGNVAGRICIGLET